VQGDCRSHEDAERGGGDIRVAKCN
jgi:hypothetical protein